MEAPRIDTMCGLRVHDLKTWPAPFKAVRAGLKPWELRLNNRDFQVGDMLRLREWEPVHEAYTGEVEERLVAWKLDGGSFGLPKEYTIMTLAPLTAQPGTVPSDALRMNPNPSVEIDRQGAEGAVRWALDLLRVEFAKPQFFTASSVGSTDPERRKAMVQFAYVGPDALARSRAMHDAIAALAKALRKDEPDAA